LSQSQSRLPAARLALALAAKIEALTSEKLASRNRRITASFSSGFIRPWSRPTR